MVRVLAILLLLMAACKPELEGRSSLVEDMRVLAVRSTPPAAKPGDEVSFDTLYVDPDGPLDPDPLDWALCTARKGLAEPGTISGKCLEREADSLESLGTGATVMATIPMDACQVFGPTPMTPEAGEPAARPVDPDTTGGYYQPVRLLVPDDEQGDQYSVGTTRLTCGLGGATQDQAAEFTRRFKPNENPELESVVLRPGDDEQSLPELGSDDVLEVAAGETVALGASWVDCPLESECGDGICGEGEDATPDNCPEDCREPHGCRGSEPYVFFDPSTRKLVDRREAMRVSWFANTGTFDHDRTSITEDEADEHSTVNNWTAPPESGDVRVWVVLRDDRGGVGWGSYQLRVQ
ncbi:MAG TPA: hypothetical protein VJV78_43740 [Polyangiales bacterium]|nr:hypothetical protein [Polyangiales bacterium]